MKTKAQIVQELLDKKLITAEDLAISICNNHDIIWKNQNKNSPT